MENSTSDAGRTVAIVNPRASSGGAGELWPAIESALGVHFPGLEVRFTEAAGHASELCRHALEGGATRILSVGGDGTNNEVLGGFIDDEGDNRFPEAILGILAAGTGGDFQRAMGRVSPRDQVRGLSKAPVRTVDYGVARFVDHEGVQAIRPFLNMASVGVSGEVVRHVNASEKRYGPLLTYLEGSLRGIAGHRNQQVEIAYDDGPARRIDLTLCAIGNGQFFGSGMWICPRAELDDGLLDVVEVAGMSRSRLVATLAKVFQGRHLRVRGVETSRARSVELRPIAARNTVQLELDGEQPGRLPARFEIHPGRLRLQIVSGRAKGRPFSTDPIPGD